MGENVIKITGKMGASQTFYVAGDGNYDTLKNIPIINLTGTDEEPILLNALETGLYRLNGIYRVNASETDKTQAENRLTIVKRVSGNDIYLQMLKPQGNIVEFYHITEADTLHKEVALSNLATVQDIPTKVSELENDSKYITEAELKTFGYATEEFVRSQGYLTEETDPTVPDHVKNITEADINKWNEKYQLPVASQTTLGGIKVGNNLSIGQDGTLNAEKSTQSYAELTNKPKINNVELDGEKSLNDLGIQAQGNYATKEELPTKTSQLENDSNFISEIPVASTSTLGGIKVGDNLEITADGVLNALGSAFPIIDATGETEIDLDNYLDDGTWIIKGHNVKQIKEYGAVSIQETNWAILEIKTQKWLSNSFVYQILRFPMMAYNNGGLQIRMNYGVRQIKPSIETSFKNHGIPISMTNHYDSLPNDGYNKVLSAIGSYDMYTVLMSYLTNNINNKPRLTNLTTTDKTSLIAAINEINAKIPSGTLATNLAEVQGYDATKTQVLKNINGQFTWVEE